MCVTTLLQKVQKQERNLSVLCMHHLRTTVGLNNIEAAEKFAAFSLTKPPKQGILEPLFRFRKRPFYSLLI